MPTDIRIDWDSILQEGNFLFANNDLTTDEGLGTAIIVSLFTDRRAFDDDILPDSNSSDKRGLWGDLVLPDVDGDQIGSRIWLLEREKTTKEVQERYKKYAEEALQWMIDDGVAAEVEAETERQGDPGNDRLALQIKIFKNDGTTITYKFDAWWTVTQNTIY